MRLVLMLVLAFLFGAGMMAAAQSAFTPARPLQVDDPIHVWLKGDNGAVTLRVHINRDGRVDRILANSATKQLRPVYEHVAKSWTFRPAMRNNEPIGSIAILRFDYRVNSTFSIVTEHQ